MKAQLVRKLWEMATGSLSIYPDRGTPLLIPDRFLLFSNLPEKPTLQALIETYQAVFAEPPWEERWKKKEVLDKLRRELAGNSFLVVMQGDKEFPVGGFAWGAVLPVAGLEERIGLALGKKPAGLEGVLLDRSVERVVYFDELAILRQFRGGLDPVRFLLWPGLELGYKTGVLRTLFWSTPESEIVPLALYAGHETIFQFQVEGKEIIFLFNPDLTPLLKVLQGLGEIGIARLLGRSRKVTKAGRQAWPLFFKIALAYCFFGKNFVK